MDTSMTLGDARDHYRVWLQDARDLSHHTVRAYCTDVSALVLSLGLHTPVAALASATVRTFFDEQRRSGMRSSSLRRRAAGIRSFCAYLHSHRLVPINLWPTDGISFQRTRSLPRAMATDDLSRLLNYLTIQARIDRSVDPDQPLEVPAAATTLLGTAIMLTTGLRVSELVSVSLPDLNQDNCTIRVLGKGRRERVVYVTDEWLRRLTSAYRVTREHHCVQHDRFLFNTLLTPLSAASMRARLADAGRSAGLDQRVTPHMLRHSAATQLIESGVNIRFVQRLLGHASLMTTEIYTHVTDQALERAVLEAGVLERSIRMAITRSYPPRDCPSPKHK
jgi:integrase/recombinase XerD